MEHLQLLLRLVLIVIIIIVVANGLLSLTLLLLSTQSTKSEHFRTCEGLTKNPIRTQWG